MDSQKKALAGALAAFQAKATNIAIICIHDLTSIADYFVICSGNSLPHLRSIREQIHQHMKSELALDSQHMTRPNESEWLAIDYGDVIFHIFSEEKREFYSLEELWSDAPRIETSLPN